MERHFGGVHNRVGKSPLPTLLTVLQCSEKTFIRSKGSVAVAGQCRCFARFICKRCKGLVCGTHAKNHPHTCKSLNGG